MSTFRALRFLVLVGGCLMITACALPPKNAPSFSQVIIPEPRLNSSILVLYRIVVEPTIFDARISINETPLVSLPNYAFTWVEIMPSEYELEVNWPGSTVSSSDKFYFERNKTYFIELQLGFNLGIFREHDFELIDKEDAIYDLKMCCSYVPAMKN